jgi:hypothetical protein
MSRKPRRVIFLSSIRISSISFKVNPAAVVRAAQNTSAIEIEKSSTSVPFYSRRVLSAPSSYRFLPLLSGIVAFLSARIPAPPKYRKHSKPTPLIQLKRTRRHTICFSLLFPGILNFYLKINLFASLKINFSDRLSQHSFHTSI